MSKLNLFEKLGPRKLGLGTCNEFINLVVDGALYASILLIQCRKFHALWYDWNDYTPMLEVGDYLHFEHIAFGASWWNTIRGIWIVVHLVLALQMCALFVFQRQNPRFLWFGHWSFCGWMIFNIARFGTAPVTVALIINIGFVGLMNLFVFKWPSETGYKMSLGMPSLMELAVQIWLFLMSQPSVFTY